MEKALTTLTHENWVKVRAVLEGEDSKKISLSAAARSVGFSMRELNAWIRRSREQRISDEPWVHEIAEVVDQRSMRQGETLEDMAWKRAMEGEPKQVWHQGQVVGHEMVKDNRILMRMLEVRNEQYRTDKNHLKITMDPTEILQKMQAVIRLARAEEEMGQVVDGELAEENKEVELMEPVKAVVKDTDDVEI